MKKRYINFNLKIKDIVLSSYTYRYRSYTYRLYILYIFLYNIIQHSIVYK